MRRGAILLHLKGQFMALTILRKTQPFHVSGDPHLHVRGLAAFTTTAANGDLDCAHKSLQSIQLQPIGAVASDEPLYVDEAAAVADGMLTRPSAGTLTIARTGAAKTSGLVFSFEYTGLAG